jgi:formylglycine-generating enzyme
MSRRLTSWGTRLFTAIAAAGMMCAGIISAGIVSAGTVSASSDPAAAGADASQRQRIGIFAIDRTEVTIQQFRAFARAASLTTAAEREGGGFEFSAGWTRRRGWTYERPQGQPGADAEPVTHVSWHEASRYCAHAGGRLPTMAEWRQAAYTETRPMGSSGAAPTAIPWATSRTA